MWHTGCVLSFAYIDRRGAQRCYGIPFSSISYVNTCLFETVLSLPADRWPGEISVLRQTIAAEIVALRLSVRTHVILARYRVLSTLLATCARENRPINVAILDPLGIQPSETVIMLRAS